MYILGELSSQIGDKTEASNKLVSEKCIQAPELLGEIANGLSSKDNKLAADCAEVLTFVSESHPDLVVSYIDAIVPLLDHKHTKVRWEATHTIAQLAATNASAVKPLLESLWRMALSDKSKIVQDYATVAIGNYGGSSKEAATVALPMLARILEIEGDRQAVRVIEGMNKLLAVNPVLHDDIREIAKSQADNTKSSIKRAYGKLVKQLG